MKLRVLIAAVLLSCGASAAVADCLAPSFTQQTFATLNNRALNTLATADFDADGKLDAVTIGWTSSVATRIVALFRGSGDGTFAAAVAIHQGPDVLKLVAKDFNGDTKPDVLILRAGGGIVFLPGNGDGTFGTPIESVVPVGFTWTIGDVTDDGIADVSLFADNPAGAETLVVLAGNGAGSFVEVHRQLLSGEGLAVTAADLDADGHGDLVLSYLNASTIELLYGNGDGTFEPAVSKPSGIQATTITIADADADGDLDILTPNWDDETISVHRNDGGRQFGAADVYVVELEHSEGETTNPNTIAVADVTGDGVLDLVVGAVNGGVLATLRGNGNGTFAAAAYQGVFGGGFSNTLVGPVITADLNGDGRIDILTSNRGSGGKIIAMTNRCGDIQTIVAASRTPTISTGQSASIVVEVSGYEDGMFPRIPPTGAISIVEGDTVIATGSLQSAETTMTISGLATGDHSLILRYAGDAQYEPAQSPPFVQHVTVETTTTTVKTEPSSSVYGQWMSVIAEVHASDATTPAGSLVYGLGTSQWFDTAPSSQRQTNVFPAGSFTGFARYAGDATHPPSEASPFTHTVSKATSTTAAPFVTTGNEEGSSAQISIAIQSQFGGAISGEAQLLDRGVVIATRETESDVPTVFSLAGLAPGRHDFRGRYLGDANSHGSESPSSTTHYVFTLPMQVDARGTANGIALATFMGGNRTILRTTAPDAAFANAASIGRIPLDQATVAGTVYLYRVENLSDHTRGPVDLGVRMTFSDDPLLPGMTIRAAHLQEIIAATNFLRGKAGQSLVTFNDVAIGQRVRASHVTTLRTRINEARVALGAAAAAFSRTIAPGDVIRAQDLQELREAVH